MFSANSNFWTVLGVATAILVLSLGACSPEISTPETFEMADGQMTCVHYDVESSMNDYVVCEFVSPSGIPCISAKSGYSGGLSCDFTDNYYGAWNHP